jgi:hypothetical protein
MIVRDPQSDLFIAICAECDTHLHIDSDSGFGAASLTTRAGWSLGMHDLCRECAETAPKRTRKR